MAIFVFDIETIPDVEFGRRLYNLEGLSDKHVAYVMQTRRRQDNGTEFLSLEQQRVVAISVALRTRDTLKVWSLGDPNSSEAVTAADAVMRKAWETVTAALTTAPTDRIFPT